MQSIDLFPFYVYKHTLVLLVFDASTELETPVIQNWLKQIRQVTHFHNYCSTTSSNPCETPRSQVKKFMFPKVILVGTHLDKISTRCQSKLEKRIKELQAQFPNVHSTFFVSSHKHSVTALKKEIKTQGMKNPTESICTFNKVAFLLVSLHEEEVTSKRACLPPVASLLQQRLQEMRSRENSAECWPDLK